MKKIFGIISLLSLGFSSHAANIYVDNTITDPAADGTSWILAYSTVDAALSAAVTGDVIKVSQGTYPTTTSYTLKDGVEMYGGYPAPGTVYSLLREALRNADVYPTLLIGGTAIKVGGSLSSATIVDGFHIEGASNCGLQIINSSATNDVIAPVFENCTFTGVYAGVQISHGGIQVIPQFMGCKFTGSHRGIEIIARVSSKLVAPSFLKCEFFSNHFGMVLVSSTGQLYPKFTDCIIRDNTGYAIDNASNTVSNGLGSYHYTASTCPATSVFDYQPEFVNSKFYGNAGILNASVVIACKPDLNIVFSNCTFNDNAPTLGNPAFNLGVANSSIQSGLSIGLFDMNNCISSNNTYNDVLIRFETGTSCSIENSMIEAQTSNSNFFGIDPAYIVLSPNGAHKVVTNIVTDNIYAGNPMYVNPTSSIPDLRLQASSPARNAGRNSLIPLNISTDFGGSFYRIIEGNVDMGAHEFCPKLGACYSTISIDPEPSRGSMVEPGGLNVNTYPNPVQNVLNIQMSEEVQVHVRIFNAMGKLMISKSHTGKELKLDFSSYPAGLYTIFVRDEFSESVHRIVKH